MIRYWKSTDPDIIHYCTTARFYEFTTMLPSRDLSPGCQLSHGQTPPNPPPTATLNVSDHPFIAFPPYIFQMSPPQIGTTIGIIIK